MEEVLVRLYSADSKFRLPGGRIPHQKREFVWLEKTRKCTRWCAQSGRVCYILGTSHLRLRAPKPFEIVQRIR